mmetsp:Transcript_22179/g.28695  ORF Transcript_22179/g.28695 Transcript_22179/m.28695 type:complete len:156 (+) Transcript_22179:77-544(+)
MGIGGQHNLTWRSVPVDWENFVHVLQKRFEKARVSTGRSRPSVAIDAYVVAYNFIGTTLGPIGVIMTLATQFSSAYLLTCTYIWMVPRGITPSAPPSSELQNEKEILVSMGSASNTIERCAACWKKRSTCVILLFRGDEKEYTSGDCNFILILNS